MKLIFLWERPVDRNLEQANNEFSTLGKKPRSKGWLLELGIILAIILCVLGEGMQRLFFFFFQLSVIAVRYPDLYFLLVVLFLIFSIIGILKSDQNDNTKLFYASALLFCFSIIAGIFYFVFPTIVWFFARD